MGAACRRDTPAKTGRPGPQAEEPARKVVGLALVQRGDVAVGSPSRTAPGSIPCRTAEATLTGRTDGGAAQTAGVQVCHQIWLLLIPHTRKRKGSKNREKARRKVAKLLAHC